MGATQSQTNASEAIADVANSVTQNTSVNQAQINSVVQSVNLDNCDISLSQDFNVTMVSSNSASAQQIASAKQDAELNNDIMQKLTQQAAGKLTGSIFAAGKQNSNNFSKQMVGLSNTISNSLFESSTQYSSSVQSFNCNGSTINARNLTLNLSSSNDFLASQMAENEQIASVTNSVSQAADQKATNVNDSGLSQFLCLILFICIGGGIFLLCSGGGIAAATSGGKGATTMAIVVPIILVVFIILSYAYQWPPMYNEYGECSMSGNNGCDDSIDCVQEEGWRNWAWGLKPWEREMPFDVAPMRYFFPLTKFDTPSPHADDVPTAENANLLDMYIANKSGSANIDVNQGRNKALADRLKDNTAWVAVLMKSDSAPDSAAAFTIIDGTDSQQRAGYAMLPGQIVPVGSVSQLTLARNAGVDNIGTKLEPTTFGPIYTPDGRVAGPSDSDVTLWSIARVGQPAPAPMETPGVCCGNTQYASYIRVPRPFISDAQQAINGNSFNCCTPLTLKVANNGDLDGIDAAQDAAKAVEGGDQCTAYNDPALSGDSSKSAYPFVSTGYFNKKFAFDDLVCDDNTTSPEIGADATPASSICGSSKNYNARSFCDADLRQDDPQAAESKQKNYLATVSDNARGAVPDSMIVSIPAQDAVLKYLNCVAPYNIVSQYNFQLDAGGELSINQEKRCRALYLRFVLINNMSMNVDLSVASDFRELIIFTDTISRQITYTTFGDLYNRASDGSPCTNTATCNTTQPMATQGCKEGDKTDAYCSSAPSLAGAKGPTCAMKIDQASCDQKSEGTNDHCQWNLGSTIPGEKNECAHGYLFVGMETTMDSPERDNFGRDGVELRKDTQGTEVGQFGVCDTSGYRLCQMFRRWLVLLLALILLAFLIYIIVTAAQKAVALGATTLGAIGNAAGGFAKGAGNFGASTMKSLSSIRPGTKVAGKSASGMANGAPEEAKGAATGAIKQDTAAAPQERTGSGDIEMTKR